MDLREKIMKATSACWATGHICRPDQSCPCREDADAVIRICFEEAARLCEERADNHGWNYHLPSVGRELAAAIRAMSNAQPKPASK